jgi:hypothetical protein
MAFPEDLKLLIVAAGADVASVFLGTKADIPLDAGPYTTIIETPGAGPDYVQNQAAPIYQYPGAQILNRAAKRTDASSRARLCYNALNGFNLVIGGVRYRSIKPTQEPWDFGLDDTGRIVYAFNVRGDKSPS